MTDDVKTVKANERSRIIYFDVLRIMAIFFVVVLHVSAENWYLYWRIGRIHMNPAGLTAAPDMFSIPHFTSGEAPGALAFGFGRFVLF